MEVLNWLKSMLIHIPGRMTSAASEKVVCGADEVYDDTLKDRQSTLNAQFKAITDQMQVSINGDSVELANSPEDIVAGSGKMPTANAIAGYCTRFLMGISEVVELQESVTLSDSVGEGVQKTIIFLNGTQEEVVVTVPSSVYSTPDGNSFVITVPARGYGELNLLNVGGTIFARGC